MIQNSVPPYLAEMRNVPWKLRIAFSNTIYLKIICRLSWCTTEYLPLNDSLSKMSSIHFRTFFDVFDVITHVTYGSSKNFKKWSNWIEMWFYEYFALLSPVLLWNYHILNILPISRQFSGHFGAKIGKNGLFLISPKNRSLVSAESPKSSK